MDPAIGVSSLWNEPNRGETLVIVGASARAAAMSARRGGLNPWAADLFADRDLRACCPAQRVHNYPDGLERALAAAPAGPWMYTGALENYPALVNRMAAVRPLYGVSREALRTVRDPRPLAAALRAAGLAVPRSLPSPSGVPIDGSWLSKPLASAGGSHIEPWYGAPMHARDPLRRYFQERIEGVPASAVYVGTGDGAIWLGATGQLIGLPWCGLRSLSADALRYCGSIGPLVPNAPLADGFQKLGRVIAKSFGLIGLFGVDLILVGDEIWPIEVNPRYAASIEVLEWAYGISAVRLHVEAFQNSAGKRNDVIHLLPERFSASSASSASNKDLKRGERRVYGKAILYSTSELVVPEAFVDWAERQTSGGAWPVVADIPMPGTALREGKPIVTVLAEGRDELSLLSDLRGLAAQIYQILAVSAADANNCRAQMS